VDCRAHCSSSGIGDVYHAECVLRFIKAQSGLQYVNFKTATHGAAWPCPRGKGKGSGQLCKSWVSCAIAGSRCYATRLCPHYQQLLHAAAPAAAAAAAAMLVLQPCAGGGQAWAASHFDQLLNVKRSTVWQQCVYAALNHISSIPADMQVQNANIIVKKKAKAPKPPAAPQASGSSNRNLCMIPPCIHVP
jgi:hypothetical protein